MPATRRTKLKVKRREPPIEKPRRLGIRAYARHRKVHHSSVQQAIAEGRIRKESDGKIDVDKADREWQENTTSLNVEIEDGLSFAAARARNEAAKAQLNELELKTKLGELVPIRDVEATWFEVLRMTRNRVLGVVDRIAEQLDDELRETLTAELRSALTTLSDEIPSVRNTTAA